MHTQTPGSASTQSSQPSKVSSLNTAVIQNHRWHECIYSLLLYMMALQVQMVKLVNRRGILCLHDLVTGVWSAEERGSTFMCRWMLDLFQPLLQILRRYGSGRGDEAQQSRTLILCGAIFNQQTAFDVLYFFFIPKRLLQVFLI